MSFLLLFLFLAFSYKYPEQIWGCSSSCRGRGGREIYSPRGTHSFHQWTDTNTAHSGFSMPFKEINVNGISSVKVNEQWSIYSNNHILVNLTRNEDSAKCSKERLCKTGEHDQSTPPQSIKITISFWKSALNTFSWFWACRSAFLG